MTREELKHSFLNYVSDNKRGFKVTNGYLNPLVTAIIDECCENVFKGEIECKVINPLVIISICFQSSYKSLQSVIKGLFDTTDDDIVTLMYRNQAFQFHRGDEL